MIGGLLLLGVIASAIGLAVLVFVAVVVLRRGPPDDGRFDPVRQLAASEGMKLTVGRAAALSGLFRGRHVHVKWKANPERTEIVVATGVRTLDARSTTDGAKSVTLRTGDPGFDETIAVRGKDTPSLLALLDDSMRAALRELIAQGGGVEPGAVLMRMPSHVLAPMALAEALERASAFAQRLESLEKIEVPARLATIAGGDPVAGMRRRATEILVEKYRSTAYAAEAARRAIADPDSGVRAQAAPLGESSAGGSALAAAVRDERASEKERRDALARAAAMLDRDDMIALYEVALSSRIPALQRDGIKGFGRLRHGQGIARLARLPAETQDEDVLVDLADALARIAGPGAESALASMLDLDNPVVQTAAAHGLGEIGSPASIARLKPIASQAIDSPELRESAADAIAAIRTRHPGAVETAEPPALKKERA